MHAPEFDNYIDTDKQLDKKLFFNLHIYSTKNDDPDGEMLYLTFRKDGAQSYYASRVLSGETVSQAVGEELRDHFGVPKENWYFVSGNVFADMTKDNKGRDTERVDVYVLVPYFESGQYAITGMSMAWVPTGEEGEAAQQENIQPLTKASENHADEEATLERGYAARDAVWKRVGALDGRVIAHMLNPSIFMGEPEWPDLRRALRVVHLDNGRTIITTDGLSDPFMKNHAFYKPDVQGFGLELYIEIAEPFSFGSAGGSWWWNMLNQAALQVAYYGYMLESIENTGGTLTIELYNVPAPEEYMKDGRVAVMIGVPSKIVPAEVAGPLGPIKLLSVTLLSLEDFEVVASGKKADRDKVAAKILAQNDGEPLSILGDTNK